MDENAAETKSTDDQLFSMVNMDGFDDLIVVDTPPEVVEEVEKVSEGGGGDTPKVEKTEDPPPVEKAAGEKPPEDNTFLVDKPKAAEPEKVIEPEKKSGEGTKVETNEENLSPMYLHAAALQEDGLLPDFDLASIKDLDTKDQILKVNEHMQKTVEDSVKELVDEQVAKMGEVKQLYEDIRNGVDPESAANNESLDQQYGKIQVKDLEEDEKAQEQIYSDYLSMKGLSDNKIKQLVDVARENQSLLTDATDGLKEIQGAIKTEREELRVNAKNQKEASEKRNAETQERIKKTVSDTKEIIPGMDLSKEEHNQIIKNMTVPVRFENDRPVSKAMDIRSKDPIAYEMRLNYFIEKGFFDKDAKFESFKTEAVTSATKKLIEKMSTEKTDLSGKPVITEAAKEDDEFIMPEFM